MISRGFSFPSKALAARRRLQRNPRVWLQLSCEAGGGASDEAWRVGPRIEIVDESRQVLDLLQQIQDTERLLASLRHSVAASPEEFAKLQNGLERMRAQAVAAMPVAREVQPAQTSGAARAARAMADAAHAARAIADAEAAEMEFGRDPRRACVLRDSNPSARKPAERGPRSNPVRSQAAVDLTQPGAARRARGELPDPLSYSR